MRGACDERRCPSNPRLSRTHTTVARWISVCSKTAKKFPIARQLQFYYNLCFLYQCRCIVDGQKQCSRLPMTCFCLALSKCTQIRPQTKCKYFKFISFSSRRGLTFRSDSTTSTFLTHSTVEPQRYWLGNWFGTICTNDVIFVALRTNGK